MNKIVQTKFGLVEGLEFEDGYKFYGIPFAKAPIGELMFKHSLEPDKWSDTYKAFKPKSNPIQREGTFSVGNNNLDCLYLNIYVPKCAKDKIVPVMVRVYGGSYATGGTGLKDNNIAEYESLEFANEVGCIIVNFNYRLNVYGYLNLNSLDKNFDLNNGISDQILALKFIKENIENFNGDKNNITLFGQSAGASSILALMTIEKAKQFFNKAITMSPVSEHFFTYKESAKLAKKYLKYLKIKNIDLKKLYYLDPEDIKVANKKLANYAYRKGELRCPFSPTVDGYDLKDFPINKLHESKKELLIGNVIDEGNLFLLKAPDIALPFMVKLFRLKVKRGKGAYRRRASDALTHKLYLDPLLKILSRYKAKAYKYEYSHTTPDCKKLGLITFHACDVPVLFNYNTSFEKVDDPETQRVGKMMRELFGKFSRNEFDDFKTYQESKGTIKIK